MGTQLPTFKKGQSPPQFSARVYCAQTAGWIKMPLGMEVKPRPRPHCARWGPSRPIFGPCLLCPNGWVDQDALDMEVGLGTVHIVLDGNLLPFPENGAQPPIFGPCLLWPNGWMDQDGTLHKGRPCPRPHCATWGPSSPSHKGHSPKNFWPMSIVAKRSTISATAEHLSFSL